MGKNSTVSIVLPLYKPRGNWVTHFVENVRKLNSCLPEESIQYIVVNDGPADDALNMLFDLITDILDNVTFISYKENRGKGFALRQGVAVAKAPYTLTMDFDFPYKIENVVELIAALKEGKDVVVGRRSRSYFRQLPLKRKVLSKSFSSLNKIFFNLPLNDTQSGIKGFNQTGKAVFLQTIIDRFLVDTEFLLRTSKNNLSVKIIDLELNPHVTFTNFGMNVIKTELKNFVQLLQLNKRFADRKPSHRKQLVRNLIATQLTNGQ